eukprot:gb/GECG01012593.1/.p1 GENE.gb/GECG01012593.1/~~gb/GECG01012593.1/.p1  ORF type:complete len:1024 (+),score=93.82 gb/GECG01012593.1/:1-3072(+)
MARLHTMKLTPKTAIVSCSLLVAAAMAIAATARSSANEYLIRRRHSTPGNAMPGNEGGASCSVSGDDRQDCAPWATHEGGVTKDECHAHGCCYDSSQSGSPWCFHPSVPAPSQQQCSIYKANRVDCFPDEGASQDKCEARGCCWVPSNSGDNVAWCFYPRTNGYSVSNSVNTYYGAQSNLTWSSKVRGPYGNDPQTVTVDIREETDNRLHVKFTEPGKHRHEVPGIISSSNSRQSAKPSNPSYKYRLNNSPFGLEVTNTQGNIAFFNSTPPAGGSFSSLIFEEQYMEISSQIPQTAKVYGIGEHVTPLELPRQADGNSGQVYTIFAKDQGTPPHRETGATNLYGSFPFYMVYDTDQEVAYGVFLLNSNAMDVILQPDAVTFRVSGGILDFYIFTGPSPGAVVQQYIDLVGHPILPPYWGLGFHLCRWGYGSIAKTEEVADSMRSNNLPQDAQWNDIDYMDQHLDFTTDPQNFPVSNFSAFVDKLHSRGQRYVMIFDPAISSTQQSGTYPPFDDGASKGVFVNDSDGNIFIGKVWPGLTAFPDFFNPKTYDWWLQQIKDFHDKIAYDGMWIDMNEPSNFCAGECPSDKAAVNRKKDAKHSSDSITDGFDPDHPPYLPGHRGGVSDINEKTVSMSALQYPGLHYNFHSMYGYSEGVASNKAMEEVLDERTLIIGRSTFPGSGVHQGHWLGDNTASWDDLYYSIPGTITFNMFGIPLVGPDICGFDGDTTAELCTRWTQLGAFYGFMRNHNVKGAKPQAPYQFGEPYTSYMRTALQTRYTLLPYIYTLFKDAHVEGSTVNRALFWEFYSSNDGDIETLSTVDKQMMLGPALLVTPVLQQGMTSVQGYFPKATWYDWFNGTILSQSVPGTVTLDAPLSAINVHIRGGYIVPTQGSGLDTVEARKNPYHLTVAFSSSCSAVGSMFVDDGVSLDSLEQDKYTELSFSAECQNNGSSGSISATVSNSGFQPEGSATWQKVRVLGVNNFSKDGTTTVGGNPVDHSYNSSSAVLTISIPSIEITSPLSIEWS